MHRQFLTPFVALALLVEGVLADQYLNVTTLTGIHGSSALQCWQISSPLATTNRSGIAGSLAGNLGPVSELLYTVTPANYPGSLHNAPDVRWVQVLSGVATITLPDFPGVSHTQLGGELGLILAADTADVSKKGHMTAFPSNMETVSIATPVKDGKIPQHKVLYQGPCKAPEFAGIRAAAVP